MKIDWFTVIAQVINFLLLVWLLRRFLYKPILKAIDEREKKIAAQIKEADDKKTEAVKEQQDFRKKNDDFDRQKKGLMDKMVTETNIEKEKLIEAAKSDAATLRSSLEKGIKNNLENQNIEIARQTQKQVFDITRKALKDMASVSLEEQSANRFIKRIQESDDGEKKQFINAFNVNTNAILIRSAFDLPEKQQGEIAGAVNGILGTKALLQFKTAPDLISGIELSTNGYKLAWSFSGYLNGLEKNVADKVKASPQTIAENG